MLIKIITTWVLFIPIAIANGFIRETTYKYFVGDLAAHQISTVIAISAFVTLVYFLRKNDFINLNNRSLLAIGLSWVVLTIVFEFFFGHYVDKASWNTLLKDYNIFDGRVWSLMLLSELLAPYFVKLISIYRK